MARPNRSNEKRAELLPIVAKAFSELGYRKATTKALAQRCGVQENILYRLWKDKKAMFAASIEYLFDATMQQWQTALNEPGEGTAAERILAYDSTHRGEQGFYRITFAALSETDDPEVKAALRSMYGRFTKFIEKQIGEHRADHPRNHPRDLPDELPGEFVATWAILGVATAADIGREIGLLTGPKRKALVAQAGRWLLEGHT